MQQTRHTLQHVEINIDKGLSVADVYESFSVISPMLQLKTIKLYLQEGVNTYLYDPIPDSANPFLQLFEVRGDTLDCFLTSPNYPSLWALDIQVVLNITVEPYSDGAYIDIICEEEESWQTKAITDTILRAFPCLASSSKISLNLAVKVNIYVDSDY